MGDMMRAISIKTKTLISMEGAGDVEVDCYSFRENGDLYIELSEGDASWLTKILILEGVSFEYLAMRVGANKDIVHGMVIRSMR